MQGKAKNGRNNDIKKSSILMRNNKEKTILLKSNKHSYGFTARERLIYTILGIIQFALLGYVFYKSLLICLLLQILLPFYLKIKEEECRKKHISELKVEFKEMLEIYQSAISAGYSAENALSYTKDEMSILGYEKGIVVAELNYMLRQLKLNVTVNELFMDWGYRSSLEDIENFASIFTLAQKTGGNLVKIMKECAVTIGEKIEVERDIETILSSKRYEQKVINFIPIFILLYMDLTSGGFLQPMFVTILGRIIMSICLCIYFASYKLSKKIMDIEV